MLTTLNYIRIARSTCLRTISTTSKISQSAAPSSTKPQSHQLFRNKYQQYEKYTTSIGACLALFGFAAVSYSISNDAQCEEQQEPEIEIGKVKPGLPTYTMADLKAHDKNAKSIWVCYKNGVYDITEFLLSHPGGREKILMAAGGSIEPFWKVFALHYNKDVYKMLESLRIGNLEIDPETERLNKERNENDPWRYDPERSPLLTVHTQKPFNAETPKELSVESLITPNEIHFIRNHLPVPKIDLENYKLMIVDEASGNSFEFELEDLKTKFKQYTLPVTIQCSGNKRKFMSEYESVHGLQWDVNAISTAEWTGVKLVDLLEYCKLKADNVKHVQFEGLDQDPTGSFYGSSIPKEKAFDVNSEVLLAFKMNGVDIPLDNGFPLRAVIPGVVGARSVKWLSKVRLSQEESFSFWQRNDYKILSPGIKNLKQADFSKYQACQESPVQSAICRPANGAVIKRDEEVLTVQGYAYSGGGRDIDTVMVSLDGGDTWQTADLKKIDRPFNKSWAWSLWECDIKIPQDKKSLDIVCAAVDSAHNVQPEGFKATWNARGLMNNSWHRIHVDLD